MRLDRLLRIARFSVPAVALVGLLTSLSVGCGLEKSDDVGISGDEINESYGHGGYGTYDGYGYGGEGFYGYGP